jgi:hypothetical protein
MNIQDRLGSEHDHDRRAYVAKYAPMIRFDRHEPFLPNLVGYTIFRQDSRSPSFPRDIVLTTEEYLASTVIEYAIWWDWDIEHLYELEHAWVYLDNDDKIIHAEASWHGGYHSMKLEGKLALNNGKIMLYSEPGKHAFAPAPDWFDIRREDTLHACHSPGHGGLWITPLCEGIIGGKNKTVDDLVRRYLETYRFEPSYNFTKEYPIAKSQLVPWPVLFDWIPQRIDWWINHLHARSGS